MSLTALPQILRADATALLLYQGPAHRSVSWSLIGPGTVTALSPCTDATGRAFARYTPAAGGEGQVAVKVECGVAALPASSLVLAIQPADAVESEPTRIAWTAVNARGDLAATAQWTSLSDATKTGTDVRYSLDWPATSDTPWAGTRPTSGELPAVYLQPADAAIALNLSGLGWDPEALGAAASATVRASGSGTPSGNLVIAASTFDASQAPIAGVRLNNSLIQPAGAFTPDPITTTYAADSANWSRAGATVADFAGAVFRSTYHVATGHAITELVVYGVPDTKRLRVSTPTTGITIADLLKTIVGDSTTPITLAPAAGTPTVVGIRVDHITIAQGDPVQVDMEVIDPPAHVYDGTLEAAAYIQEYDSGTYTYVPVSGTEVHHTVAIGGGTFSPDPLVTTSAPDDLAQLPRAQAAIASLAGARIQAQVPWQDLPYESVKLYLIGFPDGASVSVSLDNGNFLLYTYNTYNNDSAAGPVTDTPYAAGVDLAFYIKAGLKSGASVPPGTLLTFTFDITVP